MKKNTLKKISIIIVALLVFVATIFTTYEEALAIDAYGRAVGIDVSSHNGTMDWVSVKNSGIDFAIIRIGYGDNEPNQHDKQAVRNMNECERLGIPYGVYIYSYALTITEVNSEVDHVITMLGGRYPEMGIWFDMEDADSYKYNHAFNPAQHGADLTNFCLTFMRGIKSKGYNNVGVYANKNYFTNILNYNAIRAEGMIWLAHWGISEPSMGCEIWQYSSDGSIPGAGNRTDMNYIYATSSLMSRIRTNSSEEETGATAQAIDGRGDVNNDGMVSSLDYIAIKKHIMGTKPITDPTSLTRADINGDGSITSLDYVEVKKILVNLGGSGSIYPSTTSISIPVGGMGSFNVIGDNIAGYLSYSQSGPIALAIKDGKDNYIDNNLRTFIVNGNSAGNASVTFNVYDSATYNAEAKSTSFTVNISVYQPKNDPGAGTGGGETSFSAPKAGSDDTSLSKLEVEGYELTDEGNDIYSCTVNKKVKKVNIIAEANDKKAKVTGDGEKELVNDVNEFELIVEAENGFSRSYKVIVSKGVERVYSLTELKEQLPNIKEKTIRIKVEDGEILDKELLDAIKEAKKTIILEKYSGEKLLYSWTIIGENITNMESFDPKVSFTPKDKNKTKELTGDIEGITLNFAYHGELPKGTKFAIDVSNKFRNKDALYLYYLDEEKGEMTLEKSEIKVTDKMAEFTLEHCSEYFLTKQGPKEAGFEITEKMVIIAGAALFVIIVAVILIIIFAGRKKKKRKAVQAQNKNELPLEEELDEIINEEITLEEENKKEPEEEQIEGMEFEEIQIEEPIEGLEFVEQNDGQPSNEQPTE